MKFFIPVTLCRKDEIWKTEEVLRRLLGETRGFQPDWFGNYRR